MPTLVEVFQSKHGFWHLVVSPSCSENTYVIAIDASSGNPYFVGIPMVDTFPDRSLAESYVKDHFESVLKQKGEGLLGIALADQIVSIGIIDKTERTAVLPGGQEVKTIRHCTFIKIPLPGSKGQTNSFDEFQLINNHYYCENYDLTRLYPSNYKSYEPDEAFCWNNAWAKPFKDLGLRFCCVTLIEGCCSSFSPSGQNYSITHVCRRSSLNPGTRYAARGLNEFGAPGNEVEAELLFTHGEKLTTIRWRRGSIPIHWKTVLNSKVSSPKHMVDTETYFEGTPEYFTQLKERYNVEDIRCVSLLQTNEGHSEAEILEYYAKAIERLYDVGCKGIFYTPFDLNQRLHEDGSREAMSDFVSYVGPMADDSGFNEGTVPDKLDKQQQTLLRFNCADSLDRTNLATFYFAMYETAEWCKVEQLSRSKDENALPNDIIPQNIIDFLAKTFVDSGNIISMMYTNTPAIKVNAIRKFSPQLESVNDTAITMQRRLQNVMNDPIRQRILETWVKPNDLSMTLRLPYTYLHVYQNCPQEILGNKVCAFRLNQNPAEIIVVLPQPMFLFSVLMMFLPSQAEKPNKLTVLGGMTLSSFEEIANIEIPEIESIQWFRYRIGVQDKWGLQQKTPKYVQFVKFQFENTISKSESIVIGNIKIEARVKPKGEDIEETQEFTTNDDASKQRFKVAFDSFMKSDKSFMECLKLESVRVGLKLTEQNRVDLCIQNCINPWIADSYARIIYQYSLPNNCAFCLRQFGDEEDRYNLIQSQRLPGLLLPDKSGNGSTVSKVVPCCKKCIEGAYLLAQMTESLAEDAKIIIKSPKLTKRVDLPIPEIERSKNISCSSQCVFCDGYDELRNLFTNDVANIPKSSSKVEMNLLFISQAIASFILLKTNSKTLNILVNNEKATEKEYNDKEFRMFSIENPNISTSLNISFEFDENEEIENDTFTISDFSIYGNILDMVAEDPNSQNQILPLKQFPQRSIQIPSPISPIVDQLKRKEIIKFSFRQKLSNIIFETRPGGPVCLSVMVVLCYNSNMVWTHNYILPEVGPSVKLSYPIEYNDYVDSAVFYYLDRTTFFRTPIIRFK